MKTEQKHEHTPIPVPEVFFDPSNIPGLRDDENSYLMACVTCGQVLDQVAEMAA